MSKVNVVSKTVKCASCNIVINEILAYLQNKVDTMDNESMVRICASAFTVTEVEKAKGLLFDSIKTNRRNISRRKDGKIQRDLEDIIAIFKETDPEVMPVFVARELNKLPPITFDHVDVTALLKDIVRLKADVREIKDTYVTTKQIEDLDSKWSNCRYTSDCRINMRRGGYLLESGPMAIQTPGDGSVTQRTIDTCHSEDYLSHSSVSGKDVSYPIDERAAVAALAAANYCEGVRASPSRSPEPTEVTGHDCARLPTLLTRAQPGTSATVMECAVVSGTERPADNMCEYDKPVFVASGDNGTSPADLCKQSAAFGNTAVDTAKMVRKLSFAETIANGEEWKKPNENENWIEVQRKRLRNRFIGSKGKAVLSCSKFKAADTKIPLFVSNVHKDVTEADIVSYIYDKTQEKVSLLKIKMKKPRDYNSYKMYVTKHNIDIFLDDNLWPSGITFRRFVNIRDNDTLVRGENNQRV